jgi:hypothetical protein
MPPLKEIPKEPVHPLELDDEEKPFEHAIQARREHYAEDCWNARQNELKNAHLKENAPLEQVAKEIDKELETSKTRQSTLAAFIRKSMKRPEAEYTPYIKAELEAQGRKKEPTSLETVLRAAITPQATQALKELNPALTEREALLLRDACFEYMIETTHLQHLEKVLTPLQKWVIDKTDTPSLDLAKEFLREGRHYNPIAKPFALLFETLSSLRVRGKQASIINMVVESVLEGGTPEQQNKVFQLIMAGGKTSVILSMLIELASEMGNVSFVLCHPSQLTSAKGSFAAFQKKRFGKDVVAVDLSLRELSSPPHVKALLRKLNDAENKRLPILMKTSFPQMVQLKQILEIKRYHAMQDGALKTEMFAHIQSLGEILSLFRKKGVSFYDEGDINLSIMTDVIIPTGEEKGTPPSHVDLIKTIYQWLISPEIRGKLNLDKNLQNELSPEELHAEILPYLAEKLSGYAPLLLKDKASFQAYVLNQIPKELEADPSNVSEQAQFLRGLAEMENSDNVYDKEAVQLIDLCKTMLVDILPIALSRSKNRHYGRDPNHPDGRIIPYIGVGQPATTEFGKVQMKLAYHFQTALNERISLGELEFLASKMNEAAVFHAKNGKIALEATPEYKQFLTMTGGVTFAEFKKPSKKQAALDYINDPEHLERRLEVEGEVAPFHAYSYPGRIESNAINNVSQFGKSVVCSGTPWNHPTYHRRFGIPALDVGTEGSVLNLLEKKVKGPTAIHEVPDLKLQSFCDLIQNHPKKNKVRALVDGGGLLKEYTNPEIAAALHASLLQNNLGGVKALIYMHTFSEAEIKAGSPKESFVLLKIDKHAKPILLKNTTREEIEKHGIKPHELFAYLDEMRATGTDIELADDAIFLNTVDHQMTMRSALQAALRARKLFRGQNVEFIASRTGRKQMVNGGATFADLRATWEKNEAKLLKLQTDRSHLKQIHDVVRSKILQELELVNSEKKLTEWSEKYLSWLIISSEERLQKHSGRLGSKQNKILALSALGNKMVEDLTKSNSPFAADAETEMGKLLKHLRTIIPPEEMMTVPLEMDLEANIEVEHETELALALQQAREIELSQELEQELDHYAFEVSEQAAEETPWNLSPDQDLLKQMTPSLTPVNQALPDFTSCFPGEVFVTRNFTHTLQQEIPLLHPRSKNVQFVLVVENNTLFLSEKEAGFFKEWLQKNPHVKAHLVGADGFPEVHREKAAAAQEPIALAVWYANFYNGNMDYLEAHPELTQKLTQGIESTAVHYLALKGRRDPLKQQKMAASKLLDFSTVLKLKEAPLHGGIEFSSRRLEKEQIHLRMRGLDEEGVGKLEPQYVPHLSTEQVKWLKTKEQLEKLTPTLANHVTLEQMKKLSSDKWQWITNEDLIGQMDEAMFTRLTDRQIGVLSREENIRRVPPSRAAHIRPLSRHFIEGVDNLLALNNAEGLSDKQKEVLKDHFAQINSAENLKGWHVPYLPDNKIPLLNDRKLIGSLPAVRAPLLTDAQWALLTHEEETFLQSLPYPLCLKIPPRLASSFSQGQVEQLQNKDAAFIAHLKADQRQYLKADLKTPEGVVPTIKKEDLQKLTKRKDLLQVPPKRRHELTDLQLKKLYSPNAQARRVHLVKAIALSLIFPFRLVAEFLFNAVRLLGILAASPFSIKMRKRVKRIAKETFVNAPARAAICSVMGRDYVRYKRLYWRFGGKG